MMKKIPFLATGLVFVAACNPTTGALTIQKPLQVNATVSNPWGGGESSIPATEIRKETINPGKYEMDVEFKNDREILLKIKANGTTEVSVNVPQGVRIPGAVGEFLLSAAQAGQPFDLQGRVDTVEQVTAPQQGYESCTYTRQETVCDYYVPCFIQPVTHTGQRQVEFTVHTINKGLSLTFVDPALHEAVATYSGNKSDSERRYTYQGLCY